MGNAFYGNPEKTYQTLESSAILVNQVVQYIKDNASKTLIDVGTGSGSLALSVALMDLGIGIVGTDNSPDCISEARSNKRKFGVNSVEFIVSNYVDEVNYCPDVIIASLPYGNEDYLTPGNDMDHLKVFPKGSYFHSSGDPFRSYSDMIESVLSKGRTTTAFIETGILPKELIAQNLKKYSSIDRSYTVHDNTGYSTTKLIFL